MDYRIQHKLKHAKEFEQQGKNLHAIQIYNSLIEEFPEFLDSYISLAEIYERTGNFDAAKSVFEIMMKLDDHTSDVFINYGQFLMRTSQWQDAVKILQKISPGDEPICSYFIGISYLISNQYELAKMHLLNFIISDEDPELIYEAYFFLSKAEYELKQFNNSLKFAKKAEVLLSDYWELQLHFAKIYHSLSMLDHSIKSVKKASKLNTKEPLVYYWAGKIYFAASDAGNAGENFSKYLDSSAGLTTEGLIDKAQKFMRLSKFKEALINFQKAEILNASIKDAGDELRKSKELSGKN